MKTITHIALLIIMAGVTSHANALDPYFAKLVGKPVVNEVVAPSFIGGQTALDAEITYIWNCHENLIGVTQREMQVGALGTHIRVGVLVEDNGSKCRAKSHPDTILVPLPYGFVKTTFVYSL